MEHHLGLGCSFGIDTGHGSVHQELANKAKAKHFHNWSKEGQGNDYITTMLLRYFAEHPDRKHNTTVSIGWSGMYRHDYICESPDVNWQWARWRADDNSHLVKELVQHPAYPWAIEFDHIVKLVRNILLTQSWLSSNNIPYVMYHAIDNSYQIQTWGVRLKLLEKQINNNSFYQWKTSQHEFCNEHQYWIDPTPTAPADVFPLRSRGNERYNVQDAHPTREGNEKWAEQVWKHILENNLF